MGEAANEAIMVSGKSHLSLQAPANRAGEARDRAHIDCRGSRGRYERCQDSPGKLGQTKEFCLRADCDFWEREIVGEGRQEIRVFVFLKPGGHFYTFGFD